MLLRDYQENIVERLTQAFNDGFKAPCVVSPCGSGKTVMMCELAKNNKNTLILLHRKELKEQMENTLENYGINMDTVRVEMIQTLVRRLSKTEKPTLIMTDENHHSLATSYIKVYDYFNDVRRIGFTATPIRLNGDGLIQTNDCLIQGLTVQELIEKNNLSPFKYYGSPLVDLSTIKKSRGDFNTTEVETALGTNEVHGRIIEHYLKFAKGTQAICYCPTVAYSEKIAEEFAMHGISSANISGNTPSDKRDNIISNFKNGTISILCNVDIVSEGQYRDLRGK